MTKGLRFTGNTATSSLFMYAFHNLASTMPYTPTHTFTHVNRLTNCPGFTDVHVSLLIQEMLPESVKSVLSLPGKPN